MDEKESYIIKMEERLRNLGKQVDEMMWKTKNFPRKAHKSFKRSAEKFRDSRKAVTDKLGEIRNTSGKSWKDLTQGLEKGINELEKGFKSAVQEFKQGETGGEQKTSTQGGERNAQDD